MVPGPSIHSAPSRCLYVYACGAPRECAAPGCRARTSRCDRCTSLLMGLLSAVEPAALTFPTTHFIQGRRLPACC